MLRGKKFNCLESKQIYNLKIEYDFCKVKGLINYFIKITGSNNNILFVSAIPQKG
jgi:hypothetical protein